MDYELIVFAEFESASGLTRAEIVELVEHGVFAPAGRAVEEWTFPESALAVARVAARLRTDFELPPASLALLLAYRERMLELEQRLRELECRLPR
ncbi:MAG TPA: chaperone modulator CbpM [Burkholderiales bacterium]